MYTVVIDGTNKLTIPFGVVDLASFRRWYDSDEFPEEGRIWFIRGSVWADMTPEQLFCHNQVRVEITSVVGGLVKQSKMGRYFMAGARLTNWVAEFSGLPDGMYSSFETLHSGRLKPVESADGGCTELEGAPDLVMEVVSQASEEKDTAWLPEIYWKAGIPEYWLIDARKLPLTFAIYRHTAKGYVAARKQDGWVKSAVLGQSFRLTQTTDVLGRPEYTLDVR
jgi:hypothetical protein